LLIETNTKIIFIIYSHIVIILDSNKECCCNTLRHSIKKKEEAIPTQILLCNNNQTKKWTYLENLDKKINKLLEMDNRSNSAFSQPKLQN